MSEHDRASKPWTGVSAGGELGMLQLLHFRIDRAVAADAHFTENAACPRDAA